VILPPPPRREQQAPERDCDIVRAVDLEGRSAQVELPPRPGLAARRVSDAAAEIEVTTEAAPQRCAVGQVTVTLDSGEDALPGVIEVLRVDPAAPTTHRLTLTLRPGSGRADIVRAVAIGVDGDRESQAAKIGIR